MLLWLRMTRYDPVSVPFLNLLISFYLRVTRKVYCRRFMDIYVQGDSAMQLKSVAEHINPGGQQASVGLFFSNGERSVSVFFRFFLF